MIRGTACLGAVLFAACVSPSSPTVSSDPQELNLPQFANVIALESRSSLLQTSDTAWTLTKTSAVDIGAKTVTWTIDATKGATTGGKLTVDGYLDVFNLGTGPATLGNIVVNLQVKQDDDHDHWHGKHCYYGGYGKHGHDHDQWVTIASDVADATQGDAATTAHVVGDDTTEHANTITETAGSGALSFTDRRFNTMFSLVPEQVVQPWTKLPLLFAASFDNNVLHLAHNTDVRFEVIVTFGNHPLGGPHHTDENVDINGNGIIDADEHKVKSVIALLEQSVPTQQNANTTLALDDNPGDISTMGTVTFTNPVINLGTTTGTVTVSYDAGASGGSITNCVHGAGTGITDPVGHFMFTAVMPLSLTTCTTAAIAQPTCTPGAPDCGWHDGDVISYDQNVWGAPPNDGPPAQIVADHFFDVFTSGLAIGGTNEMDFSGPDALLTYLPQAGAPAALDADLSDPTSTSAGVFGGQVAALRLNVDFADAGYTAGTSAVRFGDMRLCALTSAPGLDNMTIRQAQAVMNTALGGDSTGFAIVDLSQELGLINSSFEGGFASTYAQQHIVNAAACP
ncbi:MAG: hypothetical protein ABI591_33965 [Kofleriaceae bacterium]